MKKEEIERGNRLIAQFMGAKMVSSSKDQQGNFTSYTLELGDKRLVCIGLSNFGNLRFDEDWNMLMPIVAKINNTKLGKNKPNPQFVIYPNIAAIVFNDPYIDDIHVREETLKMSVFIACFRFVEWLNKNKEAKV